MRLGPLAILSTLALPGPPIRAQEGPSDLLALLATPVVASSKREQPLLEAPQAVEVLRGRDLRTMGIFRLADALKLMTDVDVLDFEGDAPTVGVRGVLPQGTGRTLQILVDGVPLYNAEVGFQDLDALPVPLDLLDRVEVIRGPSSALYGANATTGVLSLTTIRPEEGTHGTIRAARGSRGTSRWSATADAARGPFALLGGFAGESYGTANAPSAYLNPTYSPRTLEDERGHGLNAYVRAEWRREGGHVWVTSGDGRKFFNVTNGPTQVPGVINGPYTDDRMALLQGGWNEDWTGAFRTEVRLTRVRSSVIYGPNPGFAAAYSDPGFLDPTGYRVHDYVNRLAEVQANWTPNQNLKVVFGADARRDQASPGIVIGLKEDQKESASGAFVNVDWGVAPAWSVNFGIRGENASLGGSRTSPRAVLSWFPGPASSVRLGYYRATRSPLFLESRLDFTLTVSQAPPFPQARIFPNPGLQPETVSSWEAGYRQGLGPFSLDLTLFRMEFDRLIAQVSVPTPAPPPVVVSATTFANQSRARDEGVELCLTWQGRAGWVLAANGAYLDFRDGSGTQATYAPRFKGNLVARFTGALLTGYLAYQYVAGTQVDVQPLLVATSAKGHRDPIRQLHGQIDWKVGPHLALGAYARNATRDSTLQGGANLGRLNLLLSARRELGLSLTFRY